jgi:hypothetical protein
MKKPCKGVGEPKRMILYLRLFITQLDEKTNKSFF